MSEDQVKSPADRRDVSGIFVRANHELSDLEHFISLTQQGLNAAAQTTRMLDFLARTAPLTGETGEEPSKAARARAQDVEKFARNQQLYGFPYLFELASIRLWTLLEAAVQDLVVMLLFHPENWKKLDVLTSIRGSLIEFARLDQLDQARHLASELRSSVSADLKLGVGGFEAQLDVTGCGGGVIAGVRRVLLELQQVRNNLVHRSGRTDAKLLETCPWIPRAIGDYVRIGSAHFRVYHAATNWYVIELAVRSASKERVEYINEGRAIQHAIAEELERCADSRWQSSNMQAPTEPRDDSVNATGSDRGNGK